MSTKALEEALRMLRAAVPADGGVVEKAVNAAKAELEAIRKAATTIARVGLGDVCGLKTKEEWEKGLDDAEDAGALMESIAKEAP